MKIGLFVGSFNPPHLGHKEIAEKIIEMKIVDMVHFVATGNYWNKNDLIDIKKRLEMLKTFETDNIKVKKSDKDYTYQILREFKDEVYLIMGADNFKNISLWKNAEEIMQHKIIVINREETVDRSNSNVIYIEDFKNETSSTRVKKLIKEKKSIRKLVGNEIEEIIKRDNLYGGKYV